MKKNIIQLSAGILIGIINGFLGAGGGIIAVPVLKKLGLEQKEAHANAVALILPLSLLSGILYITKNYVSINDAFSYIPTGLLGALIGAFFLKKISPFWLKKIFSLFMIYAGVRLLLR